MPEFDTPLGLRSSRGEVKSLTANFRITTPKRQDCFILVVAVVMV